MFVGSWKTVKLLNSIVQRLVDQMPICSWFFFLSIFIKNFPLFFPPEGRSCILNCVLSFVPFVLWYPRLLDMYLDPQDGKEPMFKAAVRLLHNHGESLDPLQVLEVSVPVSHEYLEALLSPFFHTLPKV